MHEFEEGDFLLRVIYLPFVEGLTRYLGTSPLLFVGDGELLVIRFRDGPPRAAEGGADGASREGRVG